MFFLDTFLKGLKPRFDDDLVDRLNYYYTPLLIIIFSLTLSAKQYVGQPIQCWVPAQFTGAWEQYAENYCFVQNTYFIPLRDKIPNDYRSRINKEIGYYQWVPFILAIQGILFYLPCLLWRMLNWQSGITFKGILTRALDVKNMEDSCRKKNVYLVATHLHDCLAIQKDLKTSAGFCGILFYGDHYGCYVTGLYLFVKLLYIVNVVTQFVVMDSFLSPRHTYWGFQILHDLYRGREWEESGHFPRVTMCDFNVRVLGNLHRWTVQCVLMINMFNEKIFLFLWWWFILVAVMTILSFLYWTVISVLHEPQNFFIHRYLRVSEDLGDSAVERRLLVNFVRRCLRPDGVFILRMIALNAGDLLVNEIVDALWIQHRAEHVRCMQTMRPPSTSKPGDKDAETLDNVDAVPDVPSPSGTEVKTTSPGRRLQSKV